MKLAWPLTHAAAVAAALMVLGRSVQALARAWDGAQPVTAAPAATVTEVLPGLPAPVQPPLLPPPAAAAVPPGGWPALFGTPAEPAPQPPPAMARAAPDPVLPATGPDLDWLLENVRLVGVIAESDTPRALVQIDGHTRILAEGAEFGPGIVLTAVGWGGAAFAGAGFAHRLDLERATPQGGTVAAQPRAPEPGRDGAGAPGSGSGSGSGSDDGADYRTAALIHDGAAPVADLAMALGDGWGDDRGAEDWGTEDWGTDDWGADDWAEPQR